MAKLNPGQHRLFRRHVDRAVEALLEAERLLRGAVSDTVGRCVDFIQQEAAKVDQEEGAVVRFPLRELPANLVPFLENPFAQGLAFNLHCERRDASHTQGQKDWEGGAAAVAARNLVFLPPIFGTLWEEGAVDKTRLVAIANRNLKPEAYEELAHIIRTRRREDVDARLLKMPATHLQMGRRGPKEAMEAAVQNGWAERLFEVEVPEDLIQESAQEPEAEGAAGEALRTLRAGTGGARVSSDVEEALLQSPDPSVLVERYLSAHRQSGDADPEEVTKTLFFAHAGPMQRLVADDKLLLRHFRPVKTQKRGQLFYRLLEVMEEAIQERAHLPELAQRGVTEREAMDAVRRVIVELNRDPNRYLQVPEEWLGEVTRRHLYFGSRTRKEGAAYKWFRRIGDRYYLGSHKTQEEIEEREKRRAERAEGASGPKDENQSD